jgi:hypothetical protein
VFTLITHVDLPVGETLSTTALTVACTVRGRIASRDLALSFCVASFKTVDISVKCVKSVDISHDSVRGLTVLLIYFSTRSIPS